jgi:hypothetical protein
VLHLGSKIGKSESKEFAVSYKPGNSVLSGPRGKKKFSVPKDISRISKLLVHNVSFARKYIG